MTVVTNTADLIGEMVIRMLPGSKRKKKGEGMITQRLETVGRCYTHKHWEDKKEEGVLPKLGDSREEGPGLELGMKSRGCCISGKHQKKGKSKNERKTMTSLISIPLTGRIQREINWQRSLRNTDYRRVGTGLRNNR